MIYIVFVACISLCSHVFVQMESCVCGDVYVYILTLMLFSLLNQPIVTAAACEKLKMLLQ